MLADLNPLLSEYVQHWNTPERDIFGQPMPTIGYTEHLARVTYTPGVEIGPASKADVTAPAATVWLFDHPRPVAVGDTFKLASGEVLKVVRVERRALAGAALTKVFLK